MKKRTLFQLLTLAIILSLTCCKTEPNPQLASPWASLNQEVGTKNFNEYWYNGTAELCSYELKQDRYGQIRDGEVVLIFVTEPFSKNKQLKLDDPEAAGDDKVTVLKLNHVRKFNTGIYDYAIMTSTFTPVDYTTHPLTLKATTSVQEWCGNTFTQLNLSGAQYNYSQRSYFESDGDFDKRIKAVPLEDALLTRLRLTQGQLPEGEIELVASSLLSRFAHQDTVPSKANITKTITDGVIQYAIDYVDTDRSLTIDVEQQFPHKILAFSENDGDSLVTTATLKKSMRSPYWKQNGVMHEPLREELGLR